MTYQYECKNCGNFEIDQSIKDEALINCPKCNGIVRRIITGGTGFILKGGGWYATDYGNRSHRPVESQEVSSSGESGSSGAIETSVVAGGND